MSVLYTRCRGGVMRNGFLIVIFILGFASVSNAAPSYGTNMPEKKTLSARFESYSLGKRYLEDNYGNLSSQQQFFGLSYGFFHWFAVDLKSGGGNITYHSSAGDKVSYKAGFAGGYGLRLKFLDQKKFKGVFGFQHISVHPRSAHIGEVKHQAILDDWQVSLLGSYDFGKVVPYLGTRWSRVDYIHTANGEKKRVMSDFTKDIGLILGLDIPVTQKLFLNIEGQLLDSQALSCSINYNF